MITEEYKKALLDIHSSAHWGTTGGVYAGDTIVEFIKAYPDIKTILDYGCGEGALKKWVEDSGITDKDWTQHDPCVAEFSKRPEGRFDLVITTDVLEHVEEEHIDDVIDDLNNLTGKYLFNEIACYFARSYFRGGPYKGKDLHISVKAPDHWMLRLDRSDMKLITSTSCVHFGWKVRYLSIQERKVNE